MPSDLRSFIREAEEAGRVYRVRREVDPYRNLGALSDESDRLIVFENVAGYEGWTVVDGLGRNREMEAIAFHTVRDKVVQTVAQRLDKGPRPHRVVKTGPVKEVIWRGEEADLKRLPFAVHSELDGGPYIGSGIGIVVDPDTRLHNTTFPRMMVRDGKRCPFFIYSPHVGRIFSKYARRKQPMEMAVVIGHHPVWEVAAASSLHHPYCGELDFVGSLLEEDTEFVKCETIDVDVPARAEIVIEGLVQPGVVADEGPFGNYLGTYASGPASRAAVQKAPVFEVQCVTMRKDRIFRHLQATVWTEHQRLCMLQIEASLYTALTEMGFEVHDVYVPPWGAASLTVIQMTPHFPGQVKDALLKALEWENTTLSFMSQVAIAVNRDVNVYDARDLIWALAIRTNWGRDAQIIPGTRCSPIMPVGERLDGVPLRLAGKVMIDATHLPPRNETELWEYSRIWPMGKGSVSLKDYVDNYEPAPLRQERLVPLDPAMVKSRDERLGQGRSEAVPSRVTVRSSGEFTTVARVQDIPERSGLCVTVDGEQVALFRVGSEVYAISNICPHQAGSLSDGDLEGTWITCPVHGWTFDVRTGEVVRGEVPVETYPVRIEGDEVKVSVRR